MPLLSIRKYAEHRNISHTAVQKAIKQGRIHLTPGGRIDVDLADRDWERNTSPVNSPSPGARPSLPHEKPQSGPTYAQSRAVRELYLARLAKLEFEERSGKLISVDEVTNATFTKARAIRDNLLNIPDRLAPMLAAESSPAGAHKILTEEIRTVRDELSSYDHG